jgi:glycosyltransferase involved in cell wall biosynthesis
LSNVLPLASKGISSNLLSYLKAKELGRRIRKNLFNASVISAESEFSLGVLGPQYMQRHFLSVNGADDEIKVLANNKVCEKSNIAVVVGTYKYKSLVDSYQVFNELRKTTNNDLKLVIIGPTKGIPANLTGDGNVIIRGLLSREKVIECLQTARFYISTTQIENSYNAASEGIFFANESYISNIGPHQELLAKMPHSLVSIPNVEPLLIKVKRDQVNGDNLLTWTQVVEQMMTKIKTSLANEKCKGKENNV